MPIFLNNLGDAVDHSPLSPCLSFHITMLQLDFSFYILNLLKRNSTVFGICLNYHLWEFVWNEFKMNPTTDIKKTNGAALACFFLFRFPSVFQLFQISNSQIHLSSPMTMRISICTIQVAQRYIYQSGKDASQAQNIRQD